jgi:hypothetical protein
LSDFAELMNSKQEISMSEVRPELAEMKENDLRFVRPVSDKGLS